MKPIAPDRPFWPRIAGTATCGPGRATRLGLYSVGTMSLMPMTSPNANKARAYPYINQLFIVSLQSRLFGLFQQSLDGASLVTGKTTPSETA
jgi:hypothetical protein